MTQRFRHLDSRAHTLSRVLRDLIGPIPQLLGLLAAASRSPAARVMHNHAGRDGLKLILEA